MLNNFLRPAGQDQTKLGQWRRLFYNCSFSRSGRRQASYFLLIIIGAFLGLLRAIFPTSVQASSDSFQTDMQVEYRVNQQGKTQVSYQITLTNLRSSIYAKEYALDINSTDVEDILVIDSENKKLPHAESENLNSTTILIQFPEGRRAIGKEQKQQFTVTFASDDTASVYGQVLEVTVPKLADPQQFKQYQVSIIVPEEFGQPSIVQPNQYFFEQVDGVNRVDFKNVGQEQGISVIFGNFQIYNLQLVYHLENNSQNVGVMQVALPPDTAWQRLTYQRIDPLPESITQDEDGNWIAEFILSGQGKVAVQVEARATIFASPQDDFLTANPWKEQTRTSWWQSGQENPFLQATEFWPVKSPLIQQLSSEYQNPQRIYQYTVDTLDYNYQRLENSAGSKRLGALAALEDPANAVCTEFTDVFVALSRAAGIPARRVIGYAVTQNSRLRPLSLVADVLHAWPEYFDSQRGLWVPVDPTWADTTGGVDYFSKLDLRHLTFAIQGHYDDRPLAAGMYKIAGEEQKDVQVSVVEDTDSQPLPFSTKLQIEKQPSFLPKIGLPITETIVVTNPSGQARYNLEVALGLTGQLHLLSQPVVKIPVLLPYQSQPIPVQIEGQDWWRAQSGELKVLINEQAQTYTIKARRAVPVQYRQTWVLGLVGAGLAIGAGSLLVLGWRGYRSLRR